MPPKSEGATKSLQSRRNDLKCLKSQFESLNEMKRNVMESISYLQLKFAWPCRSKISNCKTFTDFRRESNTLASRLAILLAFTVYLSSLSFRRTLEIMPSGRKRNFVIAGKSMFQISNTPFLFNIGIGTKAHLSMGFYITMQLVFIVQIKCLFAGRSSMIRYERDIEIWKATISVLRPK